MRCERQTRTVGGWPLHRTWADLHHSSVGIVEEHLEVLVEVSGILSHLLLEQLEQTVEGYLTEWVVGFF